MRGNSWREVTANFRIENASLEPTLTLIVKGGFLEFTLSYIVNYAVRTALQDQLFSQIVSEIKKSNGASCLGIVVEMTAVLGTLP